VDELLRGRRHRSPAIQHHPHAQERLLPHTVGGQQDVREDEQEQEGNAEDGEASLSTPQWVKMRLLFSQKKVRQASERDIKYQVRKEEREAL